ncbi:MAG: LacI family transcriptional regulator [Defluviitaleaceae bacterium]|nr:LacI family transcriptional regulator [Defluviitaleaceae bacterium]MCL2274923.1 LacI family transcriptional regulator [Defluviitaleaceae bacterium]
MQKDANIYDIARISGVSKSTVSRVLNGHKGVSEDTRKRVMQAISDNTYVPNNSARSLSSITTQSIVLLVHGITHPFFARIITSILKKMNEQNVNVILHNYEANPSKSMADEAISICKEKRPRGIILLGGYFEESYPLLQALGIPIVMISTTVHGAPNRDWFSSITLNDYHEGEKMAGYVCQFNHKSIAVIGRYHARESGMNRVFNEFGVSPHYAELEHDDTQLFRTGYNAAHKLLEHGQYSCIMCLSDVYAIGAMKAVQERGLRIPEDISIFGFDGLEHGAYTNPTLTSFIQPFDEMAEKSVSTMIGLLSGEGQHSHFVLNTTLEEGGTFRPL